jgi:hypothetical protein
VAATRSAPGLRTDHELTTSDRIGTARDPLPDTCREREHGYVRVFPSCDAVATPTVRTGAHASRWEPLISQRVDAGMRHAQLSDHRRN